MLAVESIGRHFNLLSDLDLRDVRLVDGHFEGIGTHIIDGRQIRGRILAWIRADLVPHLIALRDHLPVNGGGDGVIVDGLANGVVVNTKDTVSIA